MYCRNCGKETNPSAEVCIKCGVKLATGSGEGKDRLTANQSLTSHHPAGSSKFKTLGIALLRVILFGIGAVLILGVYTAFVAPLNPARFIFMLIGLMLMAAYSWFIVSKFRGNYSAAATAGQLCISFLFVTFQFMQSAAANPTDGEQASIFLKVFIVLLVLYVVLKLKHRTTKN